MVESVIKCYALYLFLPCATRPNGSGHPGRCGNAACKGQNFHAELCPLSISPEIVGSRLNNGAASVFLGALGERHGGLQHALHCSYGASHPDLSLRGGRRLTWQSRGTWPDHRKTIGEIAAAFPRLPRRLRLFAMTNPGALSRRIAAAMPAAASFPFGVGEHIVRKAALGGREGAVGRPSQIDAAEHAAAVQIE